MSETDSFIQEVTEEVRRDRMFALWKKWGPLVIVIIVAIVAGTAAWTWMKAQEVESARARGALFLQTDPEDVAANETLVAGIDGPASVVARLRAAAAMSASGDRAGAAKLWRDIASASDLEPAFRDLALLQALRAEAVERPSAEIIGEIGPLVAVEAPFRLLAMELRAALYLNTGDNAAAHDDLRRILADPAATQDQRLRAQEMLVASGGAGG